MDNTFVRSDMLPPQPPPMREQGAVKWPRDNLFSGWLNSILTILGILAIFWLVKASLPWLLHSVWNANSLTECRQIIAEKWGPDATGACWALIRDRWHQFLFGFYPQDLYWRPVMCFFLLFAAITPVLFFGNRRTNLRVIGGAAVLMIVALLLLTGAKGQVTAAQILFAVIVSAILLAVAYFKPAYLLWFTALYPAMTFWFLWGGSIWGPVMVIAGAGIMALVFRVLVPRFGAPISGGIAFVVACIWWLKVQTYFSTAIDNILPWSLTPVNSDQFGGFLLAFTIGVTAIIGSLPIGILLALGRKSDMPLVKWLSVGDIEFVRGVPLITMLFTASLLLQYFLPPQVKFDLILRVIILVTLFSSAYIAEVIRGGLAALPRGQYEAADALGLDYWQAQRFIIMPQALKISIPGIVSSFIGLFKDTTLVAFVGLADPLGGIVKIVRADINWKGVYWEPYIFVGAIFFIFCFSMSRYSMYLERKLKRDHR